MMKKSLLLILALLSSYMIYAQNNIYIINESFDESEFPASWTTMGNGVNNWKISTSNIAGGKPNEAEMFWQPQFNGISRLVSPAVNLTDIESAVLTLKHYPTFYSGQATVGVATSSDNGNTWNNVWSEQYNSNGQYTILENITGPDMGKNNVMFCIYFEGNSFAISSWYFDDFKIYTVEDLKVELTSIDVPTYISTENREISFTLNNSGNTEIQTFKARYEIGNSMVEQTFYTNLPSMESEQYTFDTDFYFEPNEDYTLSIEIVSANDTESEDINQSLSKDIFSAMGHTQMTPMIEHFSSSTCSPCVFVNNNMKELTDNHPGQYTYAKYCSNGPGLGDPYYTEEIGVKMDYYNVVSVPQIFFNGIDNGNAAITEEQFTACYNSEAFANVRGAFNVEGNTINVTADFMSYLDLENVRAYVSVNEKITTGNVGSNGETEFRHIMMKMLENAEGNIININAGEYQHLEFSCDLSGTNVEEMNDLEVALWLQDYDSKTVFNSHYAYENSEHCYPVQNMQAYTADNGNLIVKWDNPASGTASAYDVYIDSELVSDNTNEMEIEYSNISSNAKVVEVVALYENDKSSVGVAKIINSTENVAEMPQSSFNIYPNPAKNHVTVSGENIETVCVYNVIGVLIDKIEMGNSRQDINTSRYEKGVYIISITDKNGNKTSEKLIIE